MTTNVITCVYCGFTYPEDTPTHGAPILTEHIKVCEKHPMRALEEELRKLKLQLTHPTIHLDYYEWLSSVKKSESEMRFVKDFSKSFEDFHAIAMFAWSRSRETVKK